MRHKNQIKITLKSWVEQRTSFKFIVNCTFNVTENNNKKIKKKKIAVYSGYLLYSFQVYSKVRQTSLQHMGDERK